MPGKAVAAAARDDSKDFIRSDKSAGHFVDSAVTSHCNDNVFRCITGEIDGITGKTGVHNLAATLLQAPDYPLFLAFAARNGIYYIKN